MYIDGFIWLPDIVEKLLARHHVTEDEVESVFFNKPRYRFVEQGYRPEENVMNENNDKQQTNISKARTLEEIAEFWDTHSLADYWDETHEVEFEVRAERRRRITLDPRVYAQLEVQARARGLLPETLVNLWVAERLTLEKAS
jgi:hypothetical protein